MIPNMCPTAVQVLSCPMFFFLITSCFSFIFFHHSLLWFWRDFSFLSILISGGILFFFAPRVFSKTHNSEAEVVEGTPEMSVLDLPDLVLECILEKLPPEGLCKMSNVCTTLREMSVSDHLWEKHLNNKWGRIVGPAAYRKWQLHITSNKDSNFLNQEKPAGLMNYFAHLWPVKLLRSSFGSDNRKMNFAPMNSIMSWYFALQSGKFWFPAQVYNRENGHVGFMLSCYDAELSYNPANDTFHARYPPHGRRPIAIETDITWDRVRAPPVNTSAHDLHVSDCLNDLQPGDHIEIQWRRNKEFPYGWWYGVVGHLETCDGNATYCRCQDSDTLVLEFNHYAQGSRWRRTILSRKDHREEGNEAEGFYGGIRKLATSQEISMWRKFWPSIILQ